MRRLTRHVGRNLEHEGGAVAVVLAILAVVLLGMVALAVDVGALYQERRELQNGADAGALAIAEDCVRALIDCTANGIKEKTLADGTAQDYADDNAQDQASYVENLDLDPASGTVTVDLLSEDSGGNRALYHWFAPLLGFESSEVRASATAAWGPPAGLRIFPLSFCIGKYDEHIDNDTDYGPPPYNIYYDNQEGDEVDCELADESENSNYSGGFGWIDITKYDVDDCHLTVSEDEWYQGKTGIAAKQSKHDGWSDCWDFLEAKADAVAESPENDPCSEPEGDEDVEPILVPIFDEHKGDGDSGQIRVDGFGAFCPTGFHFGGGTHYPDKMVCGDSNNKCIRGWFTDYIEIGDVATGGNQNFGVETFGLID